MMDRFSRLWVGAHLGLLGALALSGCASSRASPRYEATVAIAPAAAAPPDTGMAALPSLPVANVDSPAGLGRIQQLEVVNQDIRLVVRSLAESFGLDYQIDPAVQGLVTTKLVGVTLAQALDAVVVPHGFAYQLEGNVLRVTAARLQTRIFSLDYVSLARAGVGNTVIQRRLGVGTPGTMGGVGGAGAAGTAGLGGAAGGSDVIQSVSIADLWLEMRISLEGLVFDAATGASSATPAAAAPLAGGGGGTLGAGAQGAFSRVDADGRRLIINPLSGTIVVAAPPETLAEVEAFLRTIEGSVQRQVLIEAKIVEVTLNESSRFGIDWEMVRRIGGANLRLGAGAGGIEFTLGTGDPAPESVSLVLDALETQGDVSVLSSPRVSVLNNQRAVMNVSTDEVFFTVSRQPILGPNGTTIGFNTEIEPQQIAVGIVLDVFAQIAPDNTITMNVRPVITDVVEVRTVELEDGTQASAPVIDRRETDTMVRVRGGETIVIGGLMQSSRTRQDRGVPVLKDIPFIGRLFRSSDASSRKRELVIFITPTIVAGQPPLSR